jgi:integrase
MSPTIKSIGYGIQPVKKPRFMTNVYKLGLTTGLRDGKVFGLEWSQIDMNARRLTTKGEANKLGVTIPLNASAMGVLMQIRSNPARHLV